MRFFFYIFQVNLRNQDIVYQHNITEKYYKIGCIYVYLISLTNSGTQNIVGNRLIFEKAKIKYQGMKNRFGDSCSIVFTWLGRNHILKL